MVTGTQTVCRAARQKPDGRENGEQIKGNREGGQSGKTRTADKSVALLGSGEYSVLCSFSVDQRGAGDAESYVRECVCFCVCVQNTTRKAVRLCVCV